MSDHPFEQNSHFLNLHLFMNSRFSFLGMMIPVKDSICCPSAYFITDKGKNSLGEDVGIADSAASPKAREITPGRPCSSIFPGDASVGRNSSRRFANLENLSSRTSSAVSR